MLGCLPLAILLWDSESHTTILSWVGATYLLTFIRWHHQRSLDSENASTEQIFRQGKVYTISVLASGIIWGSVAFLFFHPDMLDTFTAIIITLIVVIGASMIALSSRPLTYAVFAFPTIMPIVVMMFLQDNLLYKWSASGVLVYMAISLVFSRNMHRLINNSLTLKYQNIDLVADLKKQTKTANKANSDKSRFLAAASHDLRQPLHAVNLFVETLNKKLTTNTQKSDLLHIQQGLDSLDELFNALLDISRIDSETLQINKQHFLLGELINKCTDQYSIQATTKHLKLNVKNCNYYVYTDPVFLEQIISNLLSNAIRYTNEGQIDIYCSHKGDNCLQLHIDDTGIGISEKNRTEIFNEFYQLNNPERDRNKGLGLGLSIVKRITTLLNYQLNFTSKVGHGTKFTLVLPEGVKKEKISNTKQQPKVENKLNNLKVMLIDNEIEILHAMDNILNDWGCDLTSTDSVAKALELIKNGYQPEIILTDYRMPGEINGCELIQLVQQQIGNIPGVVITGDTDNDVIAEITTAKQVRLPKPIKPAQLRIAINHLIQ